MNTCRDFARWVIEEAAFQGALMEGAAVQEKAIELGLLVEVKYDPAVHGETEMREPGDPWFEFSGELATDIEPRVHVWPAEWEREPTKL